MADIEETVASLTAKIKEAEALIQAKATGGDFDLDEVMRIVTETRTPLLAKRARLILSENKGKIDAALDALKDMISEAVSNSGLDSLLGETVGKISWFNEEGETYLNINPKNLRRLPKTRVKKEAVVNTGLSEVDEVFRVVDGQREVMTISEVVQKFASSGVKATSVWEKKAWSTLFPKVNEDLGELKFTLVSK